jgi:ATP-dependent RNA helicase DHX8/PRP22
MCCPCLLLRRIESLLVVPISKVSAQQRAGRAGRTGHSPCTPLTYLLSLLNCPVFCLYLPVVSSAMPGPGQCYRLYSSDCYGQFGVETIPEIMRCNLSNTLLYLKVSMKDGLTSGRVSLAGT